MATADRKEKQIQLPTEKLDSFNGFSLDFGGSVVKVAYLSNADWTKEGCKGAKENCGIVRLISFSREEFDSCLEFLKNNCYVKRTSEQKRPLMYTCGIGGYQYGKKIEEELNVSTKNENEMDCFKSSAQYFVNNHSPAEFCVKPFTEIKKSVLQNSKAMVKMFLGMAETDFDPDNKFKDDVQEILDREYDPFSNIRPYILASFGSAWACLRCGADDMFTGCGFTVFAGRSFLGLGTLLTGAQTYDELMALAEKGNNLNLDFTFDDISKVGEKKADNSEDMYAKWMESDLAPKAVFLWGKGVGKKLEDFSKEDIARTLLNTMGYHLAQTAITAQHLTRTKHIFIAGSFICHPLTQRIVAEEYENLRWWAAMSLEGIDGDYHLHMLDFGSHFGAIGCFLNGPVRAARKLKEAEEKRRKEEAEGKKEEGQVKKSEK